MLQDTERSSSAWRQSKTAQTEEETRCLLQEFAEQKRKERQKDPEMKRVKNKYRLRAPAYPVPRNVLCTGKQLPRTPGPGILPLLPSQIFEPRTDEESFSSCAVKTTDNTVPCGRQLPRTPIKDYVLREVQGNIKEGKTLKSTTKNVVDGGSAAICDAAEGKIARSEGGDENCEVPGASEVVSDLENLSSAGGMLTAQKMMTGTEKRSSAGGCSQTTLSEQDTRSLLQVYAEQKREEREKDPEVKRVKNKYKLKAPAYASPGNVLHTEKQLPSTLDPGDLPVEPSQVFEPDLENLSSSGGMVTMQREPISEDTDAFCMPVVQNNRRISEMPVRGLNQMRISGVLKKMAGYEYRNEDLEFLKHVENQEKAKVLKKELLCLRKDLAATKQENELVLAKREKIEEDIEKMKLSRARTVALGRGVLSRMQEPTSIADLSPDDVLKQLNFMTIQNVNQQTRQQLAAAEKELARRQEDAANRTSLDENHKRSLTLKLESSEQHVKEVQYRIQQLKEEVTTLRAQIKRSEEDKSELEASVHKKRQQIGYCLKHVKQNSEMSEEEREKMNRRLQRILHRKDNYLERERILKRLKEDLR
ncbi:intracellular protein transport protein USO1-like isoform X2 [Bufo gargarizans]|nr:intracellular protein transport protein USO1-like isoform X2 [Bufo gargarizans]